MVTLEELGLDLSIRVRVRVRVRGARFGPLRLVEIGLGGVLCGVFGLSTAEVLEDVCDLCSSATTAVSSCPLLWPAFLALVGIGGEGT